MRGVSPERVPGLIPAHAGSTLHVTAQHLYLLGSSPLTRGARVRHADLVVRRGLIPAHAGSTSSPLGVAMCPGAHPRSRGEHRRSRLMRRSLGWLIPAHAGSTVHPGAAVPVGGAHPRSRGEHACAMLILWSAAGSSPLTRGAQWQMVTGRMWMGLIPAHAGSTIPRGEDGAVEWAHPRSRGEHVSVSERVQAVRGSSPLTRGARLESWS